MSGLRDLPPPTRLRGMGLRLLTAEIARIDATFPPGRRPRSLPML